MNREIWKKNIDALREENWELKELLQEAEEEIFDGDVSFGLSLVEDKQVLYAQKEEKTYQLDVLYNSDELMDMWFQLKKPGYMAKVLFCGFGNGMYVRKFLEDGDETGKIFVYEPSLPLLRFVLQNLDVSGLLSNERLWLLAGESGAALLEDRLEDFIEYADLKHLIYQAYPNYMSLFREQVKWCDERVGMAYSRADANQTLIVNSGEIYYQNTLHNMKLFKESRSLSDLYEKFPRDIPAVIVASGPSLDKNIEELKRAKGKCFLIAADSAIRVLLKHDIIPDCYVTIDGSKSIRHFQDERVDNIPVLCTLNSNHAALASHKGVSFFVNDLNAYVNAFMEDHDLIFPYLPLGGSVANGAAALAGALELKTVILVGQDLAYTDNKTHSAESVRGEMNIDVNSLGTNTMVEGYYGGEVLSSYEFKIYKEWFERFIVAHEEIKVINATEGGAMIRGAENQKLSEALDSFCVKEIPVREIFEQTEFFFEEKEKEEFEDYMRAIPERLQEMKRVVEKGMREYDKLLELAFRGKLGGEMSRILKRTGEITDRLENEPVMSFINDRVQREAQALMENIYEVKESPREEILEAGKLGKAHLEILKRYICLSLEEWKTADYGWGKN